MEKWKDIGVYKGIDYTNMYKISNFGRVKSLKRFSVPETRTLKLAYNDAGYHIVNFCKNGKCKVVRVHRLVGMYFIKKPNHLKEVPFNKLSINHKDGIKTNNHISNLEWCTHKENLIHAFENYLIPTQHKILLKNDQGERYYFRSKAQGGLFLNRCKGYLWSRLNDKKSKYAYSIKGERYEIIELQGKNWGI